MPKIKSHSKPVFNYGNISSSWYYITRVIIFPVLYNSITSLFHNWRLEVLHKLGNAAHSKACSLRWGMHLCCPCQICSAAFLMQRCKCSCSLHPWLHSFAVPAKVCHKDVEKAAAAFIVSCLCIKYWTLWSLLVAVA